MTTWTQPSHNSTSWTPSSKNASQYATKSGVFYNEAGRTYNAVEQATTSGKRYYNGLTPSQIRNLTPQPTVWAS